MIRRVDIGAAVLQQANGEFGESRSPDGLPSELDFVAGPLAAAVLAFRNFDDLGYEYVAAVRSYTVVDSSSARWCSSVFYVQTTQSRSSNSRTIRTIGGCSERVPSSRRAVANRAQSGGGRVIDDPSEVGSIEFASGFGNHRGLGVGANLGVFDAGRGDGPDARRQRVPEVSWCDP